MHKAHLLLWPHLDQLAGCGAALGNAPAGTLHPQMLRWHDDSGAALVQPDTKVRQAFGKLVQPSAGSVMCRAALYCALLLLQGLMAYLACGFSALHVGQIPSGPLGGHDTTRLPCLPRSLK